MYTIEDLPEDLVEDDEKAQFIKKEIRKQYGELNKQAKTATELEIKIGEMLNALKQVVRKNGEKWNRHIEENFPYMNIRTAQRWMKLGEAIDIENHPRLAYAGHTRLLALADLAKRIGLDVYAFLHVNGISLNFKKKKVEVRKFRDQIDDLIEEQNASPKKRTKTTANALINRFLKAAKELTKKLEATVDAEETEAVDKEILEQSIEEVEELLEQLKLIQEQLSGKRKKVKKAAS